jgi:CubicO group peptidase (beta-lactamase class C family)
VRIFSIATAVLLGTVVFGPRPEAQGLTFSLFERYLDSFRVQAGVPGMSAIVTQYGTIVWEKGFGRRDVDAALPALPDTPYLIGGLSQTFGATLLLRKCIDQWGALLDDAVRLRHDSYPDATTTHRQLLSHTAPGGIGYQYSPERFAALTPVIERCARMPYRVLVASEIFDRFAMRDSAPEQALATPTLEDGRSFSPEALAHYAQVVGRMALPYRVVAGRPQRNTELLLRPADAAEGIISSVRDLARFDAVLSRELLLAPETRDAAWTQSFSGGVALPTGLGWFVQNYDGEPIIWQFGLRSGGHSSLILKAPRLGLTFILLANSDGLSAPFALEQGDVTSSLFAQLFLRLFVP